MNTYFIHEFLRDTPPLPAMQPRSQQLLQLQQFEVGLWVLVTEVEDDLQPPHQLLQPQLCAHLGCLDHVLFRQREEIR